MKKQIVCLNNSELLSLAHDDELATYEVITPDWSVAEKAESIGLLYRRIPGELYDKTRLKALARMNEMARAFLRSHKMRRLEDVPEFTGGFVPLLQWDLLLRQLSESSSEPIYRIPRPPEGLNPVLALDYELWALPSRLFPQTSHERGSPRAGSTPRWPRTPELKLLNIDLALAFGLQLRDRIRPWYRNPATHPALPNSRVLVIGQRTKRAGLIHLLKDLDIEFTLWDNLDLGAGIEIQNLKHLLELVRTTDSLEEAIWAYWEAYSQSLRHRFQDFDVQRLHQFDLLLTDHDYAPEVRWIISDFIKRRRDVVLFPEGAQTAFSSITPYLHCSRVTRFVLSEYEQKVLQELESSNKTIVTGYFGSFFRNRVWTRLIALLLWARTLQVYDWRRRRPKVLLVLDIHEGPNLEYLYVNEGTMRMLKFMNENTSYRSCAKLRCEVRKLRRQFPRVSFSSIVPWRSLAEKANVVVCMDSSVGIEALREGNSVLHWKPHPYSTLSDSWAAYPSRVLQTISREQDLDKALLSLTNADQEDGKVYQFYLDNQFDAARRWLEAHAT